MIPSLHQNNYCDEDDGDRHRATRGCIDVRAEQLDSPFDRFGSLRLGLDAFSPILDRRVRGRVVGICTESASEMRGCKNSPLLELFRSEDDEGIEDDCDRYSRI